MSCLTNVAYFLLSWPIIPKARLRYAKNLNMFNISMRFRPISTDRILAWFYKGCFTIDGIVFILVVQMLDEAEFRTALPGYCRSTII